MIINTFNEALQYLVSNPNATQAHISKFISPEAHKWLLDNNCKIHGHKVVVLTGFDRRTKTNYVRGYIIYQ